MKLKRIEGVVNADREAPNPDGTEIYKLVEQGHPIDLYVDSETGVQYFVLNAPKAAAICPRYKSDGSLFV